MSAYDPLGIDRPEIPFSFNELVESREITSGDSGTATLKYVMRGEQNEQTALQISKSRTPTYYAGFPRESVAVKPIGDPLLSMSWYVTITYSTKGGGEEDEGLPASTETFDTGGGTLTVKNALSNQTNYGDDSTQDLRAINQTDSGVEGVDIITPVYNFTETHYFEGSAVDAAYKGDLFRLTGKINNAAFRVFGAEEVLFRGASGTQTPEGYWQITFNFSASPSQTSISISDDITVATKEGWQYLWVQYKETEGDSKAGGKKLIKSEPVGAYVADVYKTGSFSNLLIGVD